MRNLVSSARFVHEASQARLKLELKRSMTWLVFNTGRAESSPTTRL